MMDGHKFLEEFCAFDYYTFWRDNAWGESYSASFCAWKETADGWFIWDRGEWVDGSTVPCEEDIFEYPWKDGELKEDVLIPEEDLSYG